MLLEDMVHVVLADASDVDKGWTGYNPKRQPLGPDDDTEGESDDDNDSQVSPGEAAAHRKLKAVQRKDRVKKLPPDQRKAAHSKARERRKARKAQKLSASKPVSGPSSLKKRGTAVAVANPNLPSLQRKRAKAGDADASVT